MWRSKTTTLKNIKRTPLMFSVIFFVALLVSLVSPLYLQSALAATPSNKEIALYDALRGGFTTDGGSCLGGRGGSGFNESISIDEWRDTDYYPVYGNNSVNVSAKADKALGDSDDEKLNCKTIVKKYIQAAYGDGAAGRQTFLNRYYGERIGDRYYLEECGTPAGGETPCEDIDAEARAFNTFVNEMSVYAANLASGSQEWYLAYAKDILLKKFSQCWKWEWNDPANPQERNESNEYDEELWVPKDGRDDSNSVGFIVETTYGKDKPAYEDGVMNCDELKDAVLDNRLLDFDIGEEYNNLTDEEKYQNVLGMLIAEGTDKLLACVAANSPALANIPMADLMQIIAKWLVDGDTQIYYPPHNGAPEGYATTEQAAAIKKCLFEAYGEALETALEEEAPPSTAEEDEASLNNDPGGEKCYDGGKTAFGIVPKNPIKWIVCGLSQLLADAIDRVNDGIESLLKFNPTEGDGESALKEVWGSILTTANILFIIAFLIVIISTALDLGIFSNYTVKKLLPRVIIALILANLSFSICANLINITNTIGEATKDIILAPLTSATGGSNIKVEGEGDAAKIAFTSAVNADGSGAFQTAVVAGLGTIVYLAIASGGAILLPVMAIVFVAAIIALTVLLLRRIIIIMLIVFAPIAFVLWALPGGEKWFQRWWKLFIQMLLMYPMIMAAFASGIFISWLITLPGGSAGLGIMTSAMAFVAIVLPYFLIPTLFKAAGGALGNLTGMINDRSKGLVDRSKNYRDNSSQYGRRKKLKAAGKEQSGQQQLFESLQANGDGKVEKLRSSYRRRQAFGMKGLTPKGRERSSTTRASMLGQTEEAVHKQQVQGLAESVRGMDQSTAKATLKAVAMNQDDKHTEAERAAAISLMTQYKDVQGLEDVQERMLQEGTKGVNGKAKKPQSLKTWNDAMGKNFSEMKAISPHLATDVSAGDTSQSLSLKHEQAFLGATEANLGGMKVEGWQKFQELNSGQAEVARSQIVANPITRANMPSDARSYFTSEIDDTRSSSGVASDPTVYTTAARTVGQTVLSNDGKVRDWAKIQRTREELIAAHQGIQDKIAALNTNPAKAKDVAKLTSAAAEVRKIGKF